MGIWSDLWELFFPRVCLICGKRLLKEEEHLCFRCLSGLPRTRMHLKADNEVEKCFWGKFSIERASAFLFYAKGGEVRKLLFSLKYYGNSDLGCFLGRCMAQELLSSGFFKGVDYIVPVPMHPRKRKERGYNQSEMLAQGLSSVTGIPVAPHLLAKTQHVGSQTRKGNYERWMNVKDVFECPLGEELENKHVLLVDDVLTTGATVVACADALGNIPGLQISVLTLAWANDI